MRRHPLRRRFAPIPIVVGITATLLFIGMAAIAVFERRGGPVSIPSRGGIRLDSVTLPHVPHYAQTDPRWAATFLGPTRELFAATGCTVCCMSMALAHHGIDIDPGELNGRLRAMNGFTRNGWLRWRKIPELCDGRIEVDLPGEPSHEVIDAALLRGDPVIAKIMLDGINQHWVLIVGKRDVDYLALDPLLDRRVIAVSERGRKIHSVRIVRRAR